MADLALGVSVGGVADAIATLQRLGSAMGVVTTQQQQNRAATDQARESTSNANNATRDASTQAIAFGQRIAGVANSVQALVGQFGGGSHTAGLVGAIANSTVQFAQLGAVAGPEGALVGGIVGALIPAIHSLMNAQNDAAEAARAHRTELEHLADQTLSERRAASIQTDIHEGVFGSDESDDILTREREMRRQSVQETLVDVERFQRQLADPGLWAEAARAPIQASLNAAQGRVDTLRHEIENIDNEVDRRGQNHAQESDRTLLNEAHDPSPHHSGPTADQRADSQTSSVRALIDALAESEQDASQFSEQLATLEQQFADVWSAAASGSHTYLEQQGQLIDSIRELQSTEHEAHEARATAAQAELDAVTRYQAAKADAREQDVFDTAKETEQAQLRHKSAQQLIADETSYKAKLHQEAQERSSQTQQATGEMISSLTSVFTLMAEGQANAGQAAELLLASFLQYISQRATVEALAQVAMAIGSYPDPAGMALHAAGAVAWGAVAVAAGVGGAALANDAQSQMSAAHGAQAAATTRDTASASHEQASQQGGGQTNFYIYPGGITTKSDLAALIADAQDHGARNGIVSRAYQRAA